MSDFFIPPDGQTLRLALSGRLGPLGQWQDFRHTSRASRESAVQRGVGQRRLALSGGTPRSAASSLPGRGPGASNPQTDPLTAADTILQRLTADPTTLPEVIEALLPIGGHTKT